MNGLPLQAVSITAASFNERLPLGRSAAKTDFENSSHCDCLALKDRLPSLKHFRKLAECPFRSRCIDG